MSAAPRIDLHTHSTASDGTLTPGRAGRRGGRGAGWTSSRSPTTTPRRLGARPWPRGRPGSAWSGARSSPAGGTACEPAIPLHLLAYLFDPDAPGTRRGAGPGAGRPGASGASGSSALLRADGVDVSWPEILGYARGRRTVGPAAHRPGADPGRPGGHHDGGVRAATGWASATGCPRRTSTSSARSGSSARPAGCRSSPTRGPPGAAGSCPTS